MKYFLAGNLVMKEGEFKEGTSTVVEVIHKLKLLFMELNCCYTANEKF